ncbi:conserved hypothetical protein [groundwater metagenome]|uniref:Glycosyltransferase 2-like domain-containing protein n=1 Tax=groundwater metagenome TaxID=717931 RepID=A0A098EFL9_9ZZZZ
MLTIFAAPKPFKGEFNLIQKNAIRSWINLGNDVEIILFGNEERIKEIAEELNIKHFPEVIKNEFGIPLVNDIFGKARKAAKHNILCYLNADIILMSDFIRAVEKVKVVKKFLMVGQRWDFDLREQIDFQNPNWENNLKKEVLKKGKLHPQTGIDCFVFKKGLFQNIPSFAIGRIAWDEWLLWYAWKNKVKIIDATKEVMIVHQNHSYLTKTGENFDPWKTKDSKRNLKLAGGYEHCFTIKDATHILTEKGIQEAPPMSLIRRLEILQFIGFFVRQRKKITKFFTKKG